MPDVHYLNVQFAAELGIPLYERICDGSAPFAEWFFSQSAFGVPFPQSVEDPWQAIEAAYPQEARALLRLTDGAPEKCRAIQSLATRLVDDWITAIDWGRYASVGFTVTFAQMVASLALAKRIKHANPACFIVFGGAAVDGEMGLETLRAFAWVDYVVHGEAERSYPRLLAELCQLGASNGIPAVSSRINGPPPFEIAPACDPQDLSATPTPDYDDYFDAAKRYGLETQHRIVVPLESSRGCWWGEKSQCTFCGLNRDAIEYRAKPAEAVCDEIVYIAKRHNQLAFEFADNVLHPAMLTELAAHLQAVGADFSLFYEVRPTLDRAAVRLLAAAGVRGVQPGIESLDTDLLRLMRKGVAAFQNIRFLKWCVEDGIHPRWNMLHGLPGESAAHYESQIETLRRLFHLDPPVNVCSVVFERFSAYHSFPERFGLKLRPLEFYRALYPLDGVDVDRLAFFFEANYRSDDAVRTRLTEIARTVDEWRALRGGTDIVCQYKQGPGFLIIEDNRPLGRDRRLERRRVVLNELQSKVYLLCDAGASLARVSSGVFGPSPSPQSVERLRRLLGWFVDEGLTLRDGHIYLSLATHAA